MRVLHYEHMGVGVILAEAQRRLGVESRVLSSSRHPFGFKEDFLLTRYSILRRLEWRRFYSYDILHSHDNLRLPSYVLRKWRGKLIQHYHDPKTTGPLYPRDVPSFASLPSILRAVPHATWLPIPADTDLLTPEKRVPHDGVRIGYCGYQTDPTKQPFIPRREIETALEKLGAMATAFPWVNIIPQERRLEYYSQIDIWVDRIGYGFYGFVAVEAAAMGIPVISQIGEEEKAWVPNCPFISVNREGVTDAILGLVEDDQLREDLGKKAREYTIEVHDWMKSAKLCLKQYEEILQRH